MALIERQKTAQSKQLDEELARYIIERVKNSCKEDAAEFYYKELLDTFAPYIFTHYKPAEARLLMSNLIHKNR